MQKLNSNTKFWLVMGVLDAIVLIVVVFVLIFTFVNHGDDNDTDTKNITNNTTNTFNIDINTVNELISITNNTINEYRIINNHKTYRILSTNIAQTNNHYLIEHLVRFDNFIEQTLIYTAYQDGSEWVINFDDVNVYSDTGTDDAGQPAISSDFDRSRFEVINLDNVEHLERNAIGRDVDAFNNIEALTLAPDNGIIAISDAEIVRIYGFDGLDVSEPPLIRIFDAGVNYLTFTPNMRYLIAGYGNDRYKVWLLDANTPEVVAEFETSGRAFVDDLEIASNDSVVFNVCRDWATASYDCTSGELIVWNFAENTETLIDRSNDIFGAIACDPERNLLAYNDFSAGITTLYNLEDMIPLTNSQASFPVQFSNGYLFSVQSVGSRLDGVVSDFENRGTGRVIEDIGSINSVVFSPVEPLVFLARGDSVDVLYQETYSLIASLEVYGMSSSTTAWLSSDGKLLYAYGVFDHPFVFYSPLE